MKRTNYFIMQAIKHSIGADTDYFSVDHASNLKQANKQFNYYKKIGDTQQHHHFYQETQIVKETTYISDDDEEVSSEELLREETWEFVGMKGKRVY